MKSIVIALTLWMFSISPAFAQIPTTDTAAIAMQIKDQAATIVKWMEQAQQMKNQLEQAEKQFNSITGSRGFGAILNDPAVRDYLPGEWQAAYDSVREQGYGGLSGRGKSIYDANHVFKSCEYLAAGNPRTACEARAVKPSQDKGFALDAYDAAIRRMTQIDLLMKKINETQDPKAIAELQGRIAVEQANIQNEQIKLQLYVMVAAAEEKLQSQREDEIEARTWSSRKGISKQPLTFN